MEDVHLRGVGPDDKKIHIKFVGTKDNCAQGAGALFILSEQDGYVRNLGAREYIISEHLREYVQKSGARFVVI